jgi:hypothetical protein
MMIGKDFRTIGPSPLSIYAWNNSLRFIGNCTANEPIARDATHGLPGSRWSPWFIGRADRSNQTVLFGDRVVMHFDRPTGAARN